MFPATMASHNTSRTMWRKAETLGKYQGAMTDELRSLLRAFGHDTNIPVKTFTDKEGTTVIKHRVVIMLPDGLAPNPVQPSGENICQVAAYEEAVVHALAIIREHKAAELSGTSFTAIPHDSLITDLEVDHDSLVKTKPKLAARLLDRYRRVVGSLYDTHQVLVQNKDKLLEERMQSPPQKEIGQGSNMAADGSYHTPRDDSHGSPIHEGPSGYATTPEHIYYPVIPPSEEESQFSLGQSDSELPIENSDGWRYDFFAGTYEDPIPVFTEDSEPHRSTGVAAYAADGANAVVVPLSSDEEEEEPMEVKFEPEESVDTQPGPQWRFDHYICTTEVCFGESGPNPNMTQEQTRGYLDSYLGMEGLMLNDPSVNDTSDSDYVPSGRFHNPGAVRRTPRQHGWTPGMFFDP